MRKAFSLFELSVAILIIALLYSSILSASIIINSSILSNARLLTKNSPVAQIDNLSIWYETTLESSFQIEDVNDGDAITTWHDQSENKFSKNNATQTTEANKPIYKKNAFGSGLPGLKFDGSNDQLSYSENDIANNFTVFLVVKNYNTHQIDSESTGTAEGTSGQEYIIFPMQAASNGGVGISMGTNGISSYEHGDNYMPPLAVYSGSAIGTKKVIVTLMVKNQEHFLYLNGSLVRDGLKSSKAKSILSYEIGGGAYGYWEGDIGEFIVFDRALKMVERRKIENYLSQKFKINIE